jgi:hypothetical protein
MVNKQQYQLEESAPEVIICNFRKPEDGGKQIIGKNTRSRFIKAAMPPVLFLHDAETDETVTHMFHQSYDVTILPEN